MQFYFFFITNLSSILVSGPGPSLRTGPRPKIVLVPDQRLSWSHFISGPGLDLSPGPNIWYCHTVVTRPRQEKIMEMVQYFALY